MYCITLGVLQSGECYIIIRNAHGHLISQATSRQKRSVLLLTTSSRVAAKYVLHAAIKMQACLKRRHHLTGEMTTHHLSPACIRACLHQRLSFVQYFGGRRVARYREARISNVRTALNRLTRQMFGTIVLVKNEDCFHYLDLHDNLNT